MCIFIIYSIKLDYWTLSLWHVVVVSLHLTCLRRSPPSHLQPSTGLLRSPGFKFLSELWIKEGRASIGVGLDFLPQKSELRKAAKKSTLRSEYTRNETYRIRTNIWRIKSHLHYHYAKVPSSTRRRRGRLTILA